MSIYISKNAINNIPLADNLANDGNGGKLRNQPLNNNPYLVGLAKNDIAYKKLKINSKGPYIVNIKMALLAIHMIDKSYTLVNDLDVNSDKFDSSLETAVMSFQSWASLVVTGVVDSKTLLAMDSKLSPEDIFDYEKKKYKGKVNENSKFKIVSKDSPNGGLKSFEIIIDGGDKITIETNEDLNAKIIANNDSAISGNLVHIVPDEKFQKEIDKNPAAKALKEKRVIDGISGTLSYGLVPSKYNIVKNNKDIPLANMDDESSKTPPSLFDDPDSKLYEIKQGDTPSKIVLDNYYGGGGYPIMDPYSKTNAIIYTLPERKPLEGVNRSEDARFQFYLNLLYYYNSEEQGTIIKEWGLTRNGYERYPVNHLDDVNIFDSAYNAGDPHPGLPNYYRFLKKMETLNPASRIVFDSAGNTTSFTTVTGKNIRIPSRKFADSMYNLLNFRHTEMLVPVVIPGWLGADPKTKMEYVVGQALDNIIDTVTDAIDSVAAEVKTDAKALYKETAAFFNAVYNFAIKSLIQYWPRGAGGKIALGGSVTWGIPINTEGNIEKSVYRKMSKEGELTIVYKKESTLGVSVNEYQGFRTKLGQNSGHGRSNKSLGINVGVGVGAGIKTIISTEYEFPIREDETALLTMIINAFGGTLITSTAEILKQLDVINLDPRQYLTKLEAAIEGNANAKIEAELKNGTTQGISIPNSNSDSDPSKNKMFGSIDTILGLIPGVSSELSFTGRFALSYEVDYGSNPFTPDHGGRVFETIEIDSKLSTQLVLESKLLGSFFQRLFINAFPVVGTLTNAILDLLSFDKGYMLGVKYKLNRTDKPELISISDFEFDQFDAAALNAVTGSTIKYTKANDKIHKEISLYFGTFSGDVDSLCEPGTEVKYSIDMGVLFKMLKNDPAYVYDLKNTLKLFKSIEYHKKVGAFNFDTSSIKRIALKNNDNDLTRDVVYAHRNFGNPDSTEVTLTTALLEASLANLKSDKFYVTGGLALDLKMTIDVVELIQVFEFYFSKLYLKYVLNAGDKPEQVAIEKAVEKHEVRIINALRTIGITEETGIEYYKRLYCEGKVPGTNVTGLLQFIKDEIKKHQYHLTIDYKKTIVEFMKGILVNNLYMIGTPPSDKDELDYGIAKIINAFNFIAALTGLEITLEAKAGLGFEAEIEGGAIGLTGGVGLDALAEITYQGILYQNGALTDLEPADALKAVYDEIHKMLGSGSGNKRVGAKTVFGLLKK